MLGTRNPTRSPFLISTLETYLDLGEQQGMDEFGNLTDNWTIPYRAKLWIVHEGDAMFSTQLYVVDPVNGVYIEITAPY